MAGRFTRTELTLVASAAAVVFTRVLAFSLTTLGFTEHARALAPAGWDAQAASLWAGIAFGAYGVTMALAQLGSGVLSDRVGRRSVLLGGSLVFVAGAAVCALATDVSVLVAGRLLQGLGGVSSVAVAAVGETVPDERRTTAMALVGIPAGVAVFLGFLAGPPLAALLGFDGLFWATAALGVLSGLPFLRRLPAPLPGLAAPRRSLSAPVLALAACGFTINFAMMAVMFDFAEDVLAPLGPWRLAGILGVAFVAMAVASRAIDRRRAAFLPIALAVLVLASSAPAFRLADGTALAVAAGCAFFASHAILSAAIPSQVSRIAGRSGGTGHGIQLVVAYLGTAAGGAVAGATADHLGLAFVALGAAAALSLALLPKLRTAQPAPPATPA